MDQQADFTDPKRWEDNELEWMHKHFYTVPLPCMMGKPRKLYETVLRLKAEIETKEYQIKDESMLLIETGFLQGRVLIEIRKPDDYDASVFELEPSQIMTTVHHGPFKTIKKTVQEHEEKVKRIKGLNPTHTWIWDFRHGPQLAGQRSDRFVVLCQI